MTPELAAAICRVAQQDDAPAVREMAVRFGVSTSTIWMVLTRNNVRKVRCRHKSSPYTMARAELLTELFAQEISVHELKDRLNALPGPSLKAAKTVLIWAGKLGLERPADVSRRLLIRAARERGPAVWTRARNERLAALLRETDDFAAILNDLNALPGWPIKSERAIAIQVDRLGLALPSGKRGRPAKPKPERAVHGRTGQSKYTEEQRALARRLYSEERRPLPEIMQALNALPGPRFPTLNAVRHKCNQWGFGRPVAVKVEMLVQAAKLVSPGTEKPPAPVPPALYLVPAFPPPRDAMPSVAQLMDARNFRDVGVARVTADIVAAWARRNCRVLRPGRILADVNAARARAGLPRFEVIPRRGQAEPLPEPHVGANYAA